MNNPGGVDPMYLGINQNKIGRIRDIKMHKETGELYLLSDGGSLWRMYK